MTLALPKLLIDGPDRNAIVAWRGDVPLAFGQLRADIGGVAAAARAQAQHRAALLCRGSYAFCAGLFGLLQAGCEIVLPPNGQPGTLQALREHFDFLVDDEFVARCPSVDPTAIVLDTKNPSLVLFTSGSTGQPKRIVKSLGQIEREVATLDGLWGGDPRGGPAFSTVSHQHIYGLMFKLLWPLASGRAFADETDELWETLLDRLKPESIIVSSPAHLERLTGFAPLPAGMRPARIFSAGAPLSLRAATESQDILGCRPTEIFGSTETGAFATRSQFVEDEPWHLLPGIQMRCSHEGQLHLLSPYVSETWFETSDMVEMVASGFRFRGRVDRVVKIEGKRVSLVDVEQELVRLPWVSAAVTVLLPDRPARLGAVVVLTEDGRMRLAELGNFRFGRLLQKALTDTQEPAGRPRVWRFVTELPSPGVMGKRRDGDILALFEKTS